MQASGVHTSFPVHQAYEFVLARSLEEEVCQSIISAITSYQASRWYFRPLVPCVVMPSNDPVHHLDA